MSCTVGETLRGNSTEYSVLEIIGEGGFGKVTKCQKRDSEEIVAVKFLKDDPAVMEFAEREVKMLKLISGMDPDRINVVKFLESFHHEDQPCLAFEMLQADLCDVLEEGRPMSLNGIRPIAKQMMVALDALQSMGIMHKDIKLDNIMMVNFGMPVRVKLIDFGLASHNSEVSLGESIQTFGHRAPEVYLGLPLTGAIDVWSLGSVLGLLYVACELFQSESKYTAFLCMIGLLGLPEDHLLRAGKHTHKYFTEVSTGAKEGQAEERKTWRLLTAQEYNRKNNAQETLSQHDVPDSLDILLHVWPLEDGEAEMDDRLAFVDFLKHVLHLDTAKRMTPSQALQHRFITMSHLSKHSDNNEYLRNSRKMMGISLRPDQESSSGSDQDAGATVLSSTESGINAGDRNKDNGPTAEKLVRAQGNITLEELKACLLKTYNDNTSSDEEVLPLSCSDGEPRPCLQEKAAETPDGPTAAETPDGPTEAGTPDGPTAGETPDGPTAGETPDGPTAGETPDGPTAAETHDGPTSGETPDGPTAADTPDGLTAADTPDGPTKETLDGAPGGKLLEELKACLPQNYNNNTLTDEEVPPPSCSGGEPTPCLQEKGTHLCDGFESHPDSNSKDVLVSQTSKKGLPVSSAEHTDSPSRPSTSFLRRVMKRVRRFFRGVRKACCCCCQVEDDQTAS